MPNAFILHEGEGESMASTFSLVYSPRKGNFCGIPWKRVAFVAFIQAVNQMLMAFFAKLLGRNSTSSS